MLIEATRGWQVPAYTLAEDMTDTAVLRIVVRNGLSKDLANAMLDDLRTQVKVLEPHPHPAPLLPGTDEDRSSFAH